MKSNIPKIHIFRIFQGVFKEKTQKEKDKNAYKNISHKMFPGVFCYSKIITGIVPEDVKILKISWFDWRVV